MNTLTFLARRYDGRTVTSIASSSRSVSAFTDPRPPSSRPSPRRSSSFSGLRPSRKPVVLPAKRAASSPSTPAHPAPPLPPMTDMSPSLPFSPLDVTTARRRLKRRLFLRCYAVVWQTMRTAWLWIIPNATHGVAHLAEAESDGDEKPPGYESATDESDKSMSDGEQTSAATARRSDAASRTPFLRIPISLPLLQRRVSDASQPPPPPYPPDVVQAGDDDHSLVTASASLDLKKASLANDPSSSQSPLPAAMLSFRFPLNASSPCPTEPLRVGRDPQATLLPNPLSVSLLTSSPSPSAARSRQPSPRPTPFLLPKKTLILDLDETLIHSTTRPLSAATGGTGMLGLGGLFGKRGHGPGHMVEVILNGRSTLYHVYKRPFVDYFLRKVSGWYTLVIFTASMQEYADPVIDWLDAGRGLFHRRFFRESCTQQQSGSYIKDLTLVDEDLSRVCLIDNSPVSYNFNPANGIPIEGWISDPSDEALLDLLPVLDSLRFTNDVRRVLGIRGF